MSWWKNTRTSGSRTPVDPRQPHYILVFPEGDEQRQVPLCSHNDDAEEVFMETIAKGYFVPFDGEQMEWINISAKEWAFIKKIEPEIEE